MPYVELEQFLDRGSIRAWWGFSWRTFFGCAAGAIVGQQLGAALYGAGSAGMAVLSVVGAAVGLVVLLKRRGIVLARRVLVLGTFALRVAGKRSVLDGTQLGGRRHDAAPVPLQIRLAGADLELVATLDAVRAPLKLGAPTGRSNGAPHPDDPGDASPGEEHL